MPILNWKGGQTITDEEKKAIEYFFNLRATIDEAYMLFDEEINVKHGQETIKQISIILNLIEKQDKEINILERRLRHLFKCETIRKYDALDSRTQNYKLDINELDSKCENCNYIRRLNIAENKLDESEIAVGKKDKIIKNMAEYIGRDIRCIRPEIECNKMTHDCKECVKEYFEKKEE